MPSLADVTAKAVGKVTGPLRRAAEDAVKRMASPNYLAQYSGVGLRGLEALQQQADMQWTPDSNIRYASAPVGATTYSASSLNSAKS